MKITLFLEASTMEETKKTISHFKNITNSYGVGVSVSKAKEYWNIMYRVLIEVNLLTKTKLKMMLNSIVNKWMGLPDEYLASKTMDDWEIIFQIYI